MKIGILGTGSVGRTIGTKMIHLGHEVMMGSRTADNAKAAEWVNAAGQYASQGTFADAAAFGELLINCTAGKFSLDALAACDTASLYSKILIDISNSLDFSTGAARLTVCNDDSIGEQLQNTYPGLKVVKALNTVNANVMVNPDAVNGGDHDIFICGNDTDGKVTVTGILKDFGWKEEHIIDLGDITNARGTEMVLPLWIRLMSHYKSPMFQFKIVR